MTTDRSGALRRVETGGIAPDRILARLAELDLAAGVSFGLVMTPRQVSVVRVAGGAIDDSEGAAGLDESYEIRLFGDGADAHWQRTGATDGRLVVLTETTGPAEADKIDFVATFERRYLLWGRKSTSTGRDGWSEVAGKRIRSIAIPLSATSGPIALQATEYVGRLDHGNAAIVAERLTGLAPVVGTPAEDVTEGGS